MSQKQVRIPTFSFMLRHIPLPLHLSGPAAAAFLGQDKAAKQFMVWAQLGTGKTEEVMGRGFPFHCACYLGDETG